MVEEVEDDVRNSFGEGWWRKGGEEMAETGGSAVRRPVGEWEEADPQGEKERGKGKENLGILGLKYSL